MSHSSSKNSGFSLAELIISLSIVAIIYAVVLSNQSAYTDSLALTNLADNIGATVSQAQVYGVGVRELSGSGGFGAPYGVSFKISGGTNTSYLYFADIDDGTINGGIYTGGDWACPPSSECLEKFNISNGNRILELCAVKNVGADDCSVATRVDITFARPTIVAKLVFSNAGGPVVPGGDPNNIKGARIKLISPKGLTRSVVVYNTGQVSVQ